MHCELHPEQPAVSKCIYCGKALCKKCAGDYLSSMCAECAAVHSYRVHEQFSVLVILTIIAALFGSILFQNFTARWISALVFSGLPSGWYFYSDYLQRVRPLVGFLYFMPVRFILTLLSGVFIMPFLLFKAFRSLLRLPATIPHSYEGKTFVKEKDLIKK